MNRFSLHIEPPSYLALHFLQVIKYITSVEVQGRSLLILCTVDVVVLVKMHLSPPVA